MRILLLICVIALTNITCANASSYTQYEYKHLIGKRVTHAMRALRVRDERSESSQIGHAVPLVTGQCQVFIKIRADGGLAGYRLRCTNPGLAHEMVDAVHQALPFPAPPTNQSVKLGFLVGMPNPTPGIR